VKERRDFPADVQLVLAGAIIGLLVKTPEWWDRPTRQIRRVAGSSAPSP
jgi:hypothetical protein